MRVGETEEYRCWIVKCYTDNVHVANAGVEEHWTREQAEKEAKGWNNEINNINGATYEAVPVRVTIEVVHAETVPQPDASAF